MPPPWHAEGNSLLSFRDFCAVALVCLVAQSASAQALQDCVIAPFMVVDVSSSEVGVLGAVYLEKGQRVAHGELVAALRTDVEEAAVLVAAARATATADRELQQRQHEFLSRKQKRFDRLGLTRAVSGEALDEARTERTLAEMRVAKSLEEIEIARLQLERDRLSLARRFVYSPINGVLVQRYKNVGEFVEGDPIAQIAQLDPLRVEIVVPLSLFGQIQIGASVKVTPELATAREAIVTHIDPIADVASGTFGVRLSLPNPNQALPAGQRCSAVIDALPPAPGETAGLSLLTPPVAVGPKAHGGRSEVPEGVRGEHHGRDVANAQMLPTASVE
ncbi:MAG: efflux RND transporter periplasmic adaptor subunit [Gammaproteobacteria bacterium]|nr:efflux RND transporter periplasmic adaptor subunit [Gammaproteobacteria bacterium]